MKIPVTILEVYSTHFHVCGEVWVINGETVMKKAKLILFILVLLLAMGQVQAKKGGPGNGGNGGGGKGGFGPLGDGCLTFLNAPGNGRFEHDGGGAYCNGSGGQVSVPVRLRFDTKKLNADNRSYNVNGSCSSNTRQALCTGGDNGLTLQMGPETDADGISINDDFDWTLMLTANNPTRVQMGIKFDNRHFLYFNKDGTCVDPDNPGGSVSAGPVYVRCDGDENGDGLCDHWTVSTDGSFPEFRGLPAEFPEDDEFATDAANACFKIGAYGDFWDHDVIADFTMKICVMGVGFTCPEAWTP